MARYVGLSAKLASPEVFPVHGAVGLLLISVAWPASWLHLGLAGRYAFVPLWLGYILLVDSVVLRRTGRSLLTRHPAAFLAMFVVSAPLWWAFEGINHYTRNWHYLGAEEYSTVHYAVVATWHFIIVVPAVFETAELVGSFGFMARFQRGAVLSVSRGVLLGCIALGLLSLAALLAWPHYLFPVTWLCVLLVLDPVNHLTGRPSLIASLGKGDWRLVASLSAAALVCGWFWEMWNYWAFPKWEYHISFVGVGPRIRDAPAGLRWVPSLWSGGLRRFPLPGRSGWLGFQGPAGIRHRPAGSGRRPLQHTPRRERVFAACLESLTKR